MDLKRRRRASTTLTAWEAGKVDLKRRRRSSSTSTSFTNAYTGEVAERLNAPVSKTGMGGFVHRGFESLPLRYSVLFRTLPTRGIPDPMDSTPSPDVA